MQHSIWRSRCCSSSCCFRIDCRRTAARAIMASLSGAVAYCKSCAAASTGCFTTAASFLLVPVPRCRLLMKTLSLLIASDSRMELLFVDRIFCAGDLEAASVEERNCIKLFKGRTTNESTAQAVTSKQRLFVLSNEHFIVQAIH